MQLDQSVPVDCGQGAQGDWYRVYTYHQDEKLVAGTPSGQDFVVFLPLYTAVHQCKDRAKVLSLPLFPCYLFVQGGLERRAGILNTPGPVSVVGTRYRPSPNPESEIQAIRQAIGRPEPHPFLQAGNRVPLDAGIEESEEFGC